MKPKPPRTGRCTAVSCTCTSYAAGRPLHGWPTCAACNHTQHVHAREEAA